MSYMSVLEITSHWAAILTSAVAVLAYGRYLLERRQKRLRLERYLESEKREARDRGQRTVLHLVAQLGMTETEIVDAAFRSRHVRRVVGVDDDGRASVLLFEYAPASG